MFAKLFGRKNRQPEPRAGDDASTEQPLLNELQDLQQSLHTAPGVDPDHIPVLDDIIESGPAEPHPSLIALDQATSELTEQRAQAGGEQHLDQLVQELVNELMPGLEAELRRRLLELAPHYLHSKPESDSAPG